ncbi:MAG: hypothetical protein R3F48_07425 [Candidatus Zixiibacteriota bacterium]
MKKMVQMLLMVMLMSLLVVPAMAQFGEPRGGGPHGRKGGPPEGPEFEKKMKAIEQYRMLKLLEVLDLDDAKADKFLQLFREQRELMKEYRDKNFAIADTLSLLLQTENADAEIERLVAKIRSNKLEEIRSFNKFFEDIDGLLDTYQMGRLTLFMERFDRGIIEDIIRKRGDTPPLDDTAPSEGK